MARAGEAARVRCESRGGNPPARLRWTLGGEDVTGDARQKNETDLGSDRRWNAVSVVAVTFTKVGGWGSVATWRTKYCLHNFARKV